MYLMEDLKMIDSRTINIKLGSPAWTSETPLGLSIFTEAMGIDCHFTLNEGSKIKE
jgi:hypothetical protein